MGCAEIGLRPLVVDLEEIVLHGVRESRHERIPGPGVTQAVECSQPLQCRQRTGRRPAIVGDIVERLGVAADLGNDRLVHP